MLTGRSAGQPLRDRLPLRRGSSRAAVCVRVMRPAVPEVCDNNKPLPAEIYERRKSVAEPDGDSAHHCRRQFIGAAARGGGCVYGGGGGAGGGGGSLVPGKGWRECRDKLSRIHTHTSGRPNLSRRHLCAAARPPSAGHAMSISVPDRPAAETTALCSSSLPRRSWLSPSLPPPSYSSHLFHPLPLPLSVSPSFSLSIPFLFPVHVSLFIFRFYFPRYVTYLSLPHSFYLYFPHHLQHLSSAVAPFTDHVPAEPAVPPYQPEQTIPQPSKWCSMAAEADGQPVYRW